MNNNDVTHLFISKCLSCEKTIEETWQIIVLGKFKSGMEGVNSIFSQLEQIIFCVDKINKDYNCKINIEELFQKLNILEKSLQIPDYVLIADLIKYEVKNLIIKWRQYVSQRFLFV